MDKRKNFDGGEIGITNDEIDLMPNANREGLNGINAGIGSGADMIISGVGAVIDPGVDVTVSDGYVFLNGEMIKVDAQVVPRTAGTDLYQFLKVITNNIAEWDRDYRDATTHNVYEKIRAVPTNVAAITGLSVVGNTMLDVMKGLIQVQSDVNQVDNTKPDYIKNFPTVLELLKTELVTSWSQNSTKVINHNTGKIPKFCTITGVAKAVNNSYSIGDRLQLSPFTHDYEHTGGTETWAFQFKMSGTTSVTLITAAKEMKGTNQTTKGQFGILNTEWNLEVNIF